MKRFEALILGVFFSAIVATGNVLASGTEANELAAESSMQILVAKRNLQIGTVVKEPEKFFRAAWATPSKAPKGAFHRLDEVKNLKLKAPISEGEFLTRAHILSKADKNRFALAMPPGHVPLTLWIEPDGLSGLSQPSDRVDLILVTKTGKGNSKAVRVGTNMLVLATDTDEDAAKPRSKLSTAVTFAVLPEDVESLKELSSKGDLRTSLHLPEKPGKVSPRKLSDLVGR